MNKKRLSQIIFGIAIVLLIGNVVLVNATIEVTKSTDYIPGPGETHWVTVSTPKTRHYYPLQIKVYVDQAWNIYWQQSEVCVYIVNVDTGQVYFNNWLGAGESTGLYNPDGDHVMVQFLPSTMNGDVYIDARVEYWWN